MKTKSKIRHTGSILTTAALLLLSGAFTIDSHAQTWTGGGDGTSWNDAANWGGAIPGSAAIHINAVPGPVINATITGTLTNNFMIGNGGIGMVTNSGTLIQTGGDRMRLGNGATDVGTFIIQDSGFLRTISALTVGQSGTGYMTIKDSAIIETAGLGLIAYSGAAFGEVTVRDSAQWIVNGSGNSALSVGYGGTGGGFLTVKDSAYVSIAAGSLDIGRTTTALGKVTLSSNNASNRATIATFGGVSGAAGANSMLIFDGGVIKAIGGAANFFRGSFSIISEGDGAFIDSNGFDIGIANTVTFGGVGGLTKLGAGNLTLNTTAANTTYTGTTFIEGGALTLTLAGQLDSSAGIVIAAGGTLASTVAQTFTDNISGAGALNLGANALTFNNTGNLSLAGRVTAGNLTKNGAGTLTLSGNNTFAGDIALNGGILGIGGASSLGAGAGKTLSITSGTIASNAVSAVVAHNVTIQNGTQFAIDATVGKVEFTGAITGDSGVAKTGAGNAILSGNLSGLSGALAVNQGGLFINDYTGNVTVANGAAFGGAGTITGNVIFSSAGTLQVGLTHNDNSVTASSTLTIAGALSFGGAATLRYDMYASGVDTLIANTASFGSAGNTIDLVNIQTGTFTLFKLTSGTFDSSILSGLATTQDGGGALSARANAAYALSDDKTEIQLISGKTNHVVTWTGASDNNWDSSTSNWSGGDTEFLNGDKVIFNSTGSHDITIMPTGAVVSEMSVTDGSYTFTGGRLVVDTASLGGFGSSFGGIQPTGGLTIDTTGTVTLDNTLAAGEMNYFQNGINVQQGTLIGSVATLGDSNITNNGKTVFNQETDAIYTGTMTGSGILGKSGTAALQIGSNLSGFTGNTELEGGTFIIADDVTYNSAFITGSNTNIVGGNNVTLTGSTVIWHGSIVMGNDAQIGEVMINGNGDIVLGNDSTINGAALAGKSTGSIITGSNSTISGSASVNNGSITLGDNSVIHGNASVITLGEIVLGGSSAIHGNATVGTGIISIGNESIIHGNATVNSGSIIIGDNSHISGGASVTGGIGNYIQLGIGSTISGGVSVRNGTILLLENSHVAGSVVLGTVGSSVLELNEGSKVDGSVTATSWGAVRFITPSGTLAVVPEITGDVTLDRGSVFGIGKIGGKLEMTGGDATDRVSITAARYRWQSGTLFYSYAIDAVLEIGEIVLGGPGRVSGYGTIKTDSITFDDRLEINCDMLAAGSGTLTITGSLVSSGTGIVYKTGTGFAMPAAPSAYSGPTGVINGTLISGVQDAISPNSTHYYIAEGASLDLRGHTYTFHEVVNNGRIYIGGNNVPSAGTKLRITGPYTTNSISPYFNDASVSPYFGSTNTSAGGFVFNVVANNNTKTLSDQLVFTDAANISGTTKIFVQFTDYRTDWTRVVFDLDPLVIMESGTVTPGTFVLDDGRGYERIVMSQRDYLIKPYDDRIELVATTAAEMPAALAANAVSIMANRAAFGSVGQRLDYLRAADVLPGNADTGVQAWAQTYYRADKLDGDLFPDSDGTVWGFQAGVDKRRKKAGSAYTTYGAFVDRNEASATLTNKTSTDLSSTGFGGYLSARSPNNWHTDLVLRYSWDSYKIYIGEAYKYKHGDQSMTTDGYTWGAMLRTAKHFDIGKDWVITPQTQLAYQHRKINDTTDTYDRTYAFGPEDMRLNVPASFEFRLGTGFRKLITVNDRISITPYLNAQFLYEFKGDLAIQTVNNTFVREDFGGGSVLFTAGLPVRLGRRIDAYIDASLQTGGPITGYGMNLGINYRW